MPRVQSQHTVTRLVFQTATSIDSVTHVLTATRINLIEILSKKSRCLFQRCSITSKSLHSNDKRGVAALLQKIDNVLC